MANLMRVPVIVCAQVSKSLLLDFSDWIGARSEAMWVPFSVIHESENDNKVDPNKDFGIDVQTEFQIETSWLEQKGLLNE